jgi:hypothetical protein
MEGSASNELVVPPRRADHDGRDRNDVLNRTGPVAEVHRVGRVRQGGKSLRPRSRASYSRIKGRVASRTPGRFPQQRVYRAGLRFFPVENGTGRRRHRARDFLWLAGGVVFAAFCGLYLVSYVTTRGHPFQKEKTNRPLRTRRPLRRVHRPRPRVHRPRPRVHRPRPGLVLALNAAALLGARRSQNDVLKAIRACERTHPYGR